MIDKLTAGKSPPQEINIVVETPKNSFHKINFDPETRAFTLKRISKKKAPGNYGFIPRTHSSDGSWIDALLLSEDPITTGIVVNSRPIGAIRTSHEDIVEDKIIAVVIGDQSFEDVEDINDLPKHILKEITDFFDFGKGTKVFNKDKAEEIISHSMELYKREFG